MPITTTMIGAVVSLGPIVVALAIALALFAGWATLMIRADRAPVAEIAPVTPVAPIAPIAPIAPAPPVAPLRVVAAAPVADKPHDDVWTELAAPEAAPEPVPEPVVVRSGSFCTVVGATGVTAAGTEMVCTATDGARPRWRRAAHELARSS